MTDPIPPEEPDDYPAHWLPERAPARPAQTEDETYPNHWIPERTNP